MRFLSDPRAIEARSMELVEELLRPWEGSFTPEELRVVKRVVHTTGDPECVGELVFRNAPVAAGIAALHRRALLICDVKMVAAGIRARLPEGVAVRVAVEEPGVAEEAARQKVTRALAGVRRLREVLPGSIVAVGNAPTALFGVLELYGAGMRPALVIGTPVGFVGAAEAKEALLATGLPAIVLRGTRGGSAIAAAVVNALAALAVEKR
ncbi:MAG: precorrin-8X methylmutase [Thermoanaerobacteraceae bacterium]|nr:precorrin-8X methylmutase [Thermoanaerobacteraceae bacterium]